MNAMASTELREPQHPFSFQNILSFSTLPALTVHQRDMGRARLQSILGHFEATENGRKNYNRPRLTLCTFRYARSDESQDIFIRAFFETIKLPIDGEDAIDFSNHELEKTLRTSVYEFSDLLLDNFFLPLVASGHKTPQPSPRPLSAIQRALGGVHEFTGTPNRLSSLRAVCLKRDRNRCAISRKFNAPEAQKRMEEDGDDAKDDDGILFSEEEPFDILEVAHILPHALTQLHIGSELEASRQVALSVLNMFDFGVAQLIDGVGIDEPFNAMSLTPSLHSWFGKFKVYFDSVPHMPNTYEIKTFLRPSILRGSVPVTRTLYLDPNQSIDPPLRRLLEIHSAVSKILHLSAAGEYIEKILDDSEKGVGSNGSTELGRLVGLRLGGWIGMTSVGA